MRSPTACEPTRRSTSTTWSSPRLRGRRKPIGAWPRFSAPIGR